ncbi:condensation domain-containing protein [Streptomyces doebereineriae]|uniref:Condensation domain-containing protein n=1 Tax=Streptomyces doebereineriae TaxID=3075528 RepID=A0ABU2VAZ9_9ACTN|nr:condensation domain-containing protein [Streptomyces sp. DSM 41640]MDT0482734.1 condensation domain-containing protein [Streptomyces sp. DSM 41640]
MTEESLVVDTSFAQQSLWLQNEIDPGQSAYNVTAAVRLRGSLDVRVLERALNTVVERHEALRTVFDLDEGEPVQVIGPMPALTVPVVDTTPGEFEEVARAELAAPFDLREGPLVRLRLLRLGEQDHVAVLVMHHIVTDGASSAILFQELTAAYQAHLAGQWPMLPELPIQYADFSVWQRDHLAGERLQSLTEHWSEALAGALPPELPTDRPRPAGPSGRGGAHHFTLPAPLVTRIEALARRRNATPFMVLLAAFNVLLARYSGQDDITVTAPMSGRTRPELEGLIGYFVNPLLLRTDLTGDPDFLELLDRVRTACLSAFRNQELPFEQAVDLVRRQSPSGRQPRAQVMMVLQAKAPVRWEAAGLDFEMVHIDTGTTKADLILDIRPGDSGHHVVLQYSTDLFETGTAERIGAHFVSVLEGIAERPDRAVSELALLSVDERDALLSEWNSPASDPVAGQVHRAVAEWTARTPGAPAVTAGDGSLDYRGLDRRSTELALQLRRSGVRNGTPVALSMQPSCALAVAALATLKAGGCCFPVDPALPEDLVRRLVAESGAVLVLTESGMRSTDEAGDADGDAAEAEDTTGPHDIAVLSWTASREGCFVTAGLTHGAVLTGARDTARFLSLVPGDHWLCPAPQPEQMLRQMFPVLLHGAKLVLSGAAEEAVSGASVLSLAGLQPEDFPGVAGTITRVVVGDTPESVRRAHELIVGGPARLVQLLSLPETAGPLLGRELPPATVTAAGRRMPGHELYVLDDRLEPVPLGVTGELYVGGLSLGPGFRGRPGLTAVQLVPDPHGSRPGARLLGTGDRARRLPDGTVELLGRTDGPQLVDGLRWDLRETERILAVLPGVEACTVLFRPTASGTSLPTAYVVPARGAHVDAPALLDRLAKSLPAMWLPSGVVGVDEIPRTASGDIDVAALPLPGEASVDGDGGYTAPRTPLEEEVARIWQELLEVECVGVSDNFFELGGHSLMAVQLAVRLREDFGIDIVLRELYDDFTVAEVAWKVLQRLVEAEAGAEA